MKWFWENCLLWMGRQMVWAEVRVVTLTQLRVQQHKRYWTSQCMRIYHLRKNKILDFLIPKGNISSTTIAFFPRGGPYFSTEFFLYMQQWNQLAHINPVLHKIQSNVMNLVHPSKTTRKSLILSSKICSFKSQADSVSQTRAFITNRCSKRVLLQQLGNFDLSILQLPRKSWLHMQTCKYLTLF